MKHFLDKLISKLKINKKIGMFLLVFVIVGIVFGSFLVVLLNDADKNSVNEYLTGYMQTIKDNKIDYFDSLKNVVFTNSILISIIWILGISIIGIPIVLIILFLKAFILGFTISIFILTYSFKGSLLSFFFLFPSQIISLLTYLLLTFYSLNLSFKIISCIINKKTFSFSYIINKYFRKLILGLILIIITGLYDTFVFPFIIKNLLSFIL